MDNQIPSDTPQVTSAQSPQSLQPAPDSQVPQEQKLKSPKIKFFIISVVLLIVLLVGGSLILSRMKKPLSDSNNSPLKHPDTRTQTLNNGSANVTTPNITPTIGQTTVSPVDSLSGKANDTKRESDMNAILNAIEQYQKDTPHQQLVFTETPKPISSTGANICEALVPTFIAGLPADPEAKPSGLITDCGKPYDSGYMISEVQTTNQIILTAPYAETTSLRVTR